MPPPNVAVPHSEFLRRSTRHDELIGGLAQIDARLQKLLAELVMMRLFDELQEALSGVAMRLACGTPYVDGTVPTLLTAPARSTAGAKDLFENLGRPRRRGVKWSGADFIAETTRYVLDAAEPFVLACNANTVVIAEMRAVRNRIAHGNESARAAFSAVVQRRYGAKLNNVSPGMMLLSPRFSPTLLEEYLTACRVIANACARA